MIFASTAACQIFIWCHYSAINATFMNVVEVGMRARAFGVAILTSHLLGDVISPPLIGTISDHTGSLPLGVALVPLSLLVGALIWLYGWRTLPDDTAHDVTGAPSTA
jgi:fucose permease